MHRFVIAASLVVTLALGLFAVTPSPASAQDVLNCGDIATQDDAQRILDADLSDPNGLDGRPGNNPGDDGIACQGGVGPGGTVTFESYFGVTPPVVESPSEAPVETAPVVEEPVETAPVVEETGGTTTSTGAATTTTATSATTATTLPSTGSGSTAATSITMTTILLALFAVASIGTGGISLIRGRRA